MIKALFPVLLASGLSACAPAPHPETPASRTMHGPLSSQLVARVQPGPPSTVPGECWAHDVLPAEIETITERQLIAPAVSTTGASLALPAQYRTVTRQKILRQRRDAWFRTPCPAVMTPEAVATLQRALQARGLYAGAITGKMDAATGTALRAYQAPLGLDSDKLSLRAAQWLGVVAYSFYGGKLHAD